MVGACSDRWAGSRVTRRPDSTPDRHLPIAGGCFPRRLDRPGLRVRQRAVSPSLGWLVMLVVAACGSSGISPVATGPPPVPGQTTASVDPHALTIANITRSLRETMGFQPLATFDNLRVTVPPTDDEVDLDVRPNLVPDARTFLLQAGSDALVAAKALIGWYPSVQRVSVTLEGTFTDAAGRSSVQPGVSLSLSSATVGAWSSGTVAAPDASTALCYADSYAIAPAIWDTLSPTDWGCLTAPSR